MAKLTHQKLRPEKPEPRIILTTPTADEARAIMHEFLDTRAKAPAPGFVVPLRYVVRQFVSWTDEFYGPVVSLWFAQQTRAARVLFDLGYPCAWWRDVLSVANISVGGAKQVSSAMLTREQDAPGHETFYWQLPDYDGPFLSDPREK